MKKRVAAALGLVWVIAAYSSVVNADGHWTEPRIPGTAEQALVLGRDLHDDGTPDEITILIQLSSEHVNIPKRGMNVGTRTNIHINSSMEVTG